jgi:hypothetical protein
MVTGRKRQGRCLLGNVAEQAGRCQPPLLTASCTEVSNGS